MPEFALCCDIEVAKALVADGAQVVICAAPAAAADLAAAVVDLRGRGGRVAAFVGDPTDPEVQVAAAAMAKELFGAEPQVVASVGGEPEAVASSVPVASEAPARQIGMPSGTVGTHPDGDSQPDS